MASKNEFPGVAVVVGGASGMGQATAKAFAASGCLKIAILDINTKGLEATKTSISEAAAASGVPQPTVVTIMCDVTSSESVQDAFKNVETEFTRIDYLVYCPGIVEWGSNIDLSLESWDRQVSVMLRGSFICCKAALKIMASQTLDSQAFPEARIPERRAQRGAIVSIASVAGMVGIRKSPAYSAAKHGLVGLVRSDALDFAPQQIRINAVAPGLIDTPLLDGTPGDKNAALANVIARTPLLRIGYADEVADVITFLVSNRASYITGSIVPVDGGYTAL